MKEKRDPRRELEDIRFRLGCGMCALAAVHDVMENGPSCPENYMDGLYGVWDYLNSLVERMDESVNALFSEDREEAAK